MSGTTRTSISNQLAPARMPLDPPTSTQIKEARHQAGLTQMDELDASRLWSIIQIGA